MLGCLVVREVDSKAMEYARLHGKLDKYLNFAFQRLLIFAIINTMVACFDSQQIPGIEIYCLMNSPKCATTQQIQLLVDDFWQLLILRSYRRRIVAPKFVRCGW